MQLTIEEKEHKKKDDNDIIRILDHRMISSYAFYTFSVFYSINISNEVIKEHYNYG